MQIRMLSAIAGAEVSWQHGDVVDVSEVVGLAWIADGLAAAIEDPAAAGAASAEPETPAIEREHAAVADVPVAEPETPAANEPDA